MAAMSQEPLPVKVPPAGPSPPSPAWAYTVSVRELCEFTAKRGDLDRRFTPSATALEGLAGQHTVAQRRGPDYESEIALETTCGPLRVRGRADGYDPQRRCLEEVKTIRGHPDQIPANRRHLHWAQLQTYGALFCRARGLAEIALVLVYFDVESQAEIDLPQVFGADELEATLAHRCDAFLAWAQQEAEHRQARDLALKALAFPQQTFRTGQRDLAEAVYRTAANGRCLLAQAPTGIGKTVGTLFPMLRAMPLHGIDKLAYLTCKGTGRLTALEALGDLRSAAPGRSLRVLALVAKVEGCAHPDKACHGDDCPLARGFFDRLPAAREEAVALGWLDAAAQRQVALRHGICPYYLGQELVRWADVLVGDVNHLFDGNALLWGLMQALDWQLAVLVDEAHNLVERARQMYSAELRISQVRMAAQAAPGAVRGALDALAQATDALVVDAAEAYAVLEARARRLRAGAAHSRRCALRARQPAAAERRAAAGLPLRAAAVCEAGRGPERALAAGRADHRGRRGHGRAQRGPGLLPAPALQGTAQHRAVLGHAVAARLRDPPVGLAGAHGLARRADSVPGRTLERAGGRRPVDALCAPRSVAAAPGGHRRTAVRCAPGQLPRLL